MNRNKAKKIFNILFLFTVFCITYWTVFRDKDFGQILYYLDEAEDIYIVPAVICVLLFILGESVVIFYLMKTLNTKVSFFHCCLYSFIGFFYSCITPSASGGQPMQVVAMRKDKIPVAVSAIVLAIVTITYKLVLVLFGSIILIIRPQSLMPYLESVESVIYLGLILNIICITGLLLLVFDPHIIRIIVKSLISILKRFFPLRNTDRITVKLDKLVNQYQGISDFFRKNIYVIVRVFLITLVQRALLFLVTWFIYRSFNLSNHTLITIVCLQAMISVAADMLPLPGGMGISETLFLEIFQPIFGNMLVLPGMILSRGISYYTQLLISAIMTVASTFILKKDNRNEVLYD